jgi:hypothetical protein
MNQGIVLSIIGYCVLCLVICFMIVSDMLIKLYKAIPVQALRVSGCWDSQILRQSSHEDGKVVSPTRRSPLPPKRYSWYSFLFEACRPQDHSAAGRIESMKNSSETIRNRTRDLPASNALPQPTVPPRAFSDILCLLYSCSRNVCCVDIYFI